MKAADFAPIRPISNAPDGPQADIETRRDVLKDALRGTVLGAYDLRLVRWAIKAFDDAALRVLVSWLVRVRRAGQVEALEAVAAHLTAAGHHAAASVTRGRAHDIRLGRWTLDDRRGEPR